MISKLGASSGFLIDSIRKTNKQSESLLGKLASGKRINKASDDPAGLAVAESLLAKSTTLEAANRNISYGYSAAAIAEGATQQISGSLTRMQELATQAANGTLSDSQREAISTEFNALKEEVNRIVGTTEFNGTNLLSGDGFVIQAGADGTSSSQISADNIDIPETLNSESFNSLSISDISSAQQSIDSLSNLIGKVSETQGTLGAVTSRLQVAENNNSSQIVALKSSESLIRDADIAEVTAKLTANKIKQQGGAALLAQAGKLQQSNILKLLA